MYKNIIAAYDGSEAARAALREAAARTVKSGGSLTVVYAAYFDEEEYGSAPDQLERRFEQGRSLCAEAVETLRSGFGVEAQTVICQGEAHEVLVNTAAEKGADLIAMGTHGRKGLKRLLMGSVTSAVVVDAPCDVLVVKKPCADCSGEYRSILLPYDGSAFGKKALESARRLSKESGAAVTALYVIPRYEEMLGFMRTDSIRKSLNREADGILAEAAKAFSPDGVKFDTVIEEGRPSDRIVEVAKRLNPDVIVMGSYGWTGVDKAIIGSTAERVIINAGCPVLVVK